MPSRFYCDSTWRVRSSRGSCWERRPQTCEIQGWSREQAYGFLVAGRFWQHVSPQPRICCRSRRDGAYYKAVPAGHCCWHCIVWTRESKASYAVTQRCRSLCECIQAIRMWVIYLWKLFTCQNVNVRQKKHGYTGIYRYLMLNWGLDREVTFYLNVNVSLQIHHSCGLESPVIFPLDHYLAAACYFDHTIHHLTHPCLTNHFLLGSH